MEASFYSTLDGNVLSRANLYRWLREFFRVSQMKPGYYLEFGVYNGESLIEAYRMLRGWITHYFGFDSFAGLPDLAQEDRIALRDMPTFHKGNFTSMNRDKVAGTIVNLTGMDASLLTLTEGFFADSLKKFDSCQFAQQGECRVCYVDCDLYSSTREVLQFIEPHITTGTWILLDDYWCYKGSPRHGQRRAFEEWIQSSKRIEVSDYGNFKGFGKAFIAYEK